MIVANMFRLTSRVLYMRHHSWPCAYFINKCHQTSQQQIRLASIDVAKNKTIFDLKDENDVLKKLGNMFNDDANDGGIIPIFKKALLYGNKTAIKDESGEYTYAQLYVAVKMLSTQISNLCGSGSSSRVAFLCPNNALYTLVQWACWMSGQIAVPLHTHHPPKLLEFYIKNSESSLIISVPEFENVMAPLAETLEKPIILVDHNFIITTTLKATNTTNKYDSWLDPKNENVLLFNDQPIIEGTLNSKFYAKSNAMIVYTSGATSLPKGSVITYKNIESQIKCLSAAWQISEQDVFLTCLPMNHIHGIINGLACPMAIGAKVFMIPEFNSSTIWSVLLNINMPSKDKISVYMGTPAQYTKLIAEYENVFSKNERMVEFIRSQCEKKIRLMVSGSAALPEAIFQKWYDITGHKLLVRYGMTEIGMCLSNPYKMDKLRTRESNNVGMPLPDCEVKLVNSNEIVLQTKGDYEKGLWNSEPLPVYENSNATQNQQTKITGELYVRGPNVINEYYNSPAETKASIINGWFKTGDIAQFENNSFKILGHHLYDIIKTGGHVVSALIVEMILLSHPDVEDACVVGINDLVWGQKIATLIVPKNSEHTEIIDLNEWCVSNMASYEIPTIIKYVKQIPRNDLGKVNKRNIVANYFSTE